MRFFQGKFDRKIGLIFENEEFNNIINELEMAVLSCQRVEQKNIALILDWLHRRRTDNQYPIIGKANKWAKNYECY